MAEIDAGHKTLIQRTKLQHLVQIAQLVDFAHSLRAEGDMAEARIVTGAQDFSERITGNIQGLPAGALHQRTGVNDDPSGAQPVRRPTGGSDIADGFFQAVRIRVGQY